MQELLQDPEAEGHTASWETVLADDARWRAPMDMNLDTLTPGPWFKADERLSTLYLPLPL